MSENSKKARYEQQTAWKTENRDRIAFEVPKGDREKYKGLAKAEGKSLNNYILESLELRNENGDKGKFDFCANIPDLAVYAKSIGLTPEEYVKIAVAEKMERQDQEYQEEIIREKLDY